MDKLIQIINQFLAELIDKFKAKNPLVYAVVIGLLFSAQFVFQNCAAWGICPEGAEWLPTTLEWVGYVLIAITGSRTFDFLPEEKQVKRLAQKDPQVVAVKKITVNKTEKDEKATKNNTANA